MKGWVIFFAIVLAVVSGGFLLSARDSDATDIPCSRMEGNVYHIHPHLSVIVDGEAQIVPAGIGIALDCMYWTHTHTPDGIIHVESPVEKDITLGNFMTVWGKFGPTLLDGKNITAVTVDGQPYEGDYNSIVFEDRQKIVIEASS